MAKKKTIINSYNKPTTTKNGCRFGCTFEELTCNHFNEIFERIKQVTGGKTGKEIGEALGVKQQAVSAAKVKKQIPAYWITTLSCKYNVSADWLLYGTGQMRRTAGPGEENRPDALNEKQPEYEVGKAEDPLDKAITQAAEELGVKLDKEGELIAKMLIKRGLKSVARKVLLSMQEIEGETEGEKSKTTQGSQ